VVVTEGQRVIGNRYRLTEPIGSGGVSVVWRAQDLLLDREVAVKEIVRPEGTSAQVQQRTLSEARAAARIRHPGVAAVYDVIAEAGRPYIVMELIEGRSLAQVIEEDGPLALPRVADIGGQVLAALTAGHAAGVLHRDLKPANVLVTPFWRVVLTDFGIASVTGDPSTTQAGVVLGTPGYLAPERARGEPATPETDMWSLGAMLYAAASGHGPYDGHEGPHATLTADGPVPEIIRALLDHDPRRRPSPARTAEVLEEAASGFSPSGFSPSTEPRRPVPPPPDRAPEGSLAAFMVGFEAPDDIARPPRQGHGRRTVLVTAVAAMTVAAAGALILATVLHRPAHHQAAAAPVAFAGAGAPVAAVPDEFRVTAAVGTGGPGGGPVLFARARNGALMTDRLAGGSWSGWTSLPGGHVYTGVPAAVRDHDGRLMVVARTASGKLALLWQPSPGSRSWDGPATVGTELTSSDPSMVALPDGRLEVFARLSDGGLGTVSQLGTAATSGWSRWSALGGSLAGPPAAALDSRGNPDVFVVGSDGSLMRRYVEDGSWQSWQTLPGGRVFAGVPAAGMNFDGRLEVFVRTSSGALEHVWQLPGRPDRWGGPLVLMTGTAGDPGVYSTPGGRIDAFVATAHGDVRHTWQVQVRDGTPWSQPASIGGDAAGAPVPVRTGAESEVFVRTPDGAIAWNRESASLTWSGWSTLGGAF
jgi:hypothetical protein